MKKGTFCKLKTSLGRNFIYNLQTFQGFCQVHCKDFVVNWGLVNASHSLLSIQESD